ncbi:energy transducer TonB [Oryzicola mucosus]|uniref:Uncharacterized protein n=1 Tax=Oryzicola mucosus TaxID=2767425 RepID=A0A8J6PJU4_9HYPH|nr:hypothetical protein [Oryzicola mucosus]MBD0416329.1 hypothetical protein [Oryzicola mucosus]
MKIFTIAGALALGILAGCGSMPPGRAEVAVKTDSAGKIDDVRIIKATNDNYRFISGVKREAKRAVRRLEPAGANKTFIVPIVIE